RGQYADIVHFLLDKDGLDLASRPKGLLPLHQYKKEVRTPFEEHLLESLELTRTEGDVCRAHFTVADDYLEEFQWFARKCVPTAEKKHKVKFDLSFSVQKRSTHTLAVDMENRPFRRADGRLLLRPGGHGALIENLNDLNGDIVFIKNIDNAAPARLQGEVVRWKKALGGLLIELQEEIFRLMTWLESRPEDDGVIDQAFRLLLGRLSITVPPSVRQGSRMEHRRFLMSKLNRPLRVCGAVENTGEPGGAPFWVQAKSGEQSIQIVEQHQVDPNSSDQQAIFAEATHFNPVDIVCALRDRTGRPFDLRRHVDPSAVFIAKKSEAGRELKALERPGLWNGGMADWNTVFVEVPAGTFNPFKTLRDLLRDGHRAEI
ncbi:MAG TPA: DUF4301 family protein, partial [Elusimicrobiota bacterium]|nr:DUF4301 family protein [Elusimicrobiota bacterium]